MATYEVFEGTYPFKEYIGSVNVAALDNKEEEAATALRVAIKQYGGHPVVCPA